MAFLGIEHALVSLRSPQIDSIRKRNNEDVLGAELPVSRRDRRRISVLCRRTGND